MYVCMYVCILFIQQLRWSDSSWSDSGGQVEDRCEVISHMYVYKHISLSIHTYIYIYLVLKTNLRVFVQRFPLGGFSSRFPHTFSAYVFFAFSTKTGLEYFQRVLHVFLTCS